MKKILVLLAAGVLSIPVYAGSSTGTIEWVRVRASDNLHYLKITGSHNSKLKVVRVGPS
ncbi:MAG: hypothetical protein OQJ89_15300 [Kangiellaceae bacterium]|nr:hypothetical protein [Kangiellaceae bacterium]MCW8997243.1 hypothetical protein [Kangiellaceae bacterium]MCW9018337.1 hypothetical protein [Kangiellaceae bacterium]